MAASACSPIKMTYTISPPTVIFISDSPGQYESAASLFRSNGYTVIFEKDVSQSIMTASANDTTLIISELAVHNIDGLALCRRVRCDEELSETPVVLVGDLSPESGIVADGFRCGASDYLQKPVEGWRLFRACEAIACRPAARGHGELSFETFPLWRVDLRELQIN